MVKVMGKMQGLVLAQVLLVEVEVMVVKVEQGVI